MPDSARVQWSVPATVMRHFARQHAGSTLRRMRTPKELLETMLSDLRSAVSADIAALARDVDDRGEDTTPSQHPADVASDLYAREELLIDELTLAAAVEEIESALGRVAAGKYGTCVECGATID